MPGSCLRAEGVGRRGPKRSGQDKKLSNFAALGLYMVQKGLERLKRRDERRRAKRRNRRAAYPVISAGGKKRGNGVCRDGREVGPRRSSNYLGRAKESGKSDGARSIF